MSEPTCADLVKASGNVIGGYEARCFQEPMGCVADDRIDCENGCMLKIAWRAGKAERDAELSSLTAKVEEQEKEILALVSDITATREDYIRRNKDAADRAETIRVLEAENKDLRAKLNGLFGACVRYDENPDSAIVMGNYMDAKAAASKLLSEGQS